MTPIHWRAAKPGDEDALSLLGLCENELRLPLVPVQSQAVKDEIKAAMQEAGVL